MTNSKSQVQRYDVIILGGGAAGLMCAIEAGKRGRKVLLLEKAEKVGKKILISGGGRCNFTNMYTEPDNYLSGNPHFCKSALSRYTQYDFIAMVEDHGITYHEKTLGQLFCDDSARQIVAMLGEECLQAGVSILCQAEVQGIEKPERFLVRTNHGRFVAESLVVATGGKSIPKMGSTGFGLEIAQQFGIPVTETRAGLVPFTLTPEELARLSPLSGVSVMCRASCNGHDFKEKLLFTHRGLSGPAMLQVSSYWHQGDEIVVDLFPDEDIEAWLIERKQAKPRARLRTIMADKLPKRLAEVLSAWWGWDEQIDRLSSKRLAEVAEQLHGWRIRPNGTEGYRTAEVMLGGVDTHAVSSKTFEAKDLDGLYFVGEVLDVTGHLGGFNFQWAWASGHAAGQVV